jgi:hypothetical protein
VSILILTRICKLCSCMDAGGMEKCQTYFRCKRL